MVVANLSPMFGFFCKSSTDKKIIGNVEEGNFEVAIFIIDASLSLLLIRKQGRSKKKSLTNPKSNVSGYSTHPNDSSITLKKGSIFNTNSSKWGMVRDSPGRLSIYAII